MDFKKMFPMKLGFGGLRLPISGSKDNINYEEMCRMADTYTANGGKYFDTSFIYHKGTSENAMAACVVDRLPRDSFCLADKMPLWKVGGRLDLQGIFETQLEKCHVDYFDFYLLHNVNRNALGFLEESDAFGFQQRLKREGKIRYAGFSFHDSPVLLDKLLSEHKDIDFVQLQINYYDWFSCYVQSKQCYETAVSHNVPVVVMETVRGGALAQLPGEAKKLLKSVRPDMSEASFALRFAAGLDNAFMVLSGMSTLAQVEDNCSYMREDAFEKLSDAEYEALSQIVKLMRMCVDIPCDGCGKCADACPQRIDIPKAFAIYNDGEKFGGVNFPDMHYNIHIREHRADSCIKCGECNSVCPKRINITDMLGKISGLYDK